MKKLLFAAIVLPMISTACSEPKTFSELIKDVPVCELPFGMDGLQGIESFEYDYIRPKMTWSTDIDSDNRYGLNGIFDYSQLGGELSHTYSLLDCHGELIFAKRFQPVSDIEVVLFYVERFNANSRPDERYPQWVLLMVSPDGEVLTAAKVADVDHLELDMTSYTLFRLDADYTLTVKSFTSPFWEDEPEDESADFVYLRSTETFNPVHLYLDSAFQLLI